MLLKNYMVLAACCTFLSATPGHVGADHDEDADYPFYGGFAIGFASADKDCDYHGYDCDGDDTSVKFYGGKRLHENLAIELSFQDLGKLDDRRGSVTATAETTGVNLSLHGIIPVDGIGYLYGKIGMMAWETDYTEITPSTRTTSDDDGTDFTFGAGFAFTFNERYDFRVEFERLNELDDNFTPGGDYITVFSFGGTVYIR
jgi:hypothetical protein